MTTRAAALERDGRVQVLSDASGRARRFDFSVATWCNAKGAVRASAIARRVEETLRRLGVKSETICVRVVYA